MIHPSTLLQSLLEPILHPFMHLSSSHPLLLVQLCCVKHQGEYLGIYLLLESQLDVSGKPPLEQHPLSIRNWLLYPVNREPNTIRAHLYFRLSFLAYHLLVLSRTYSKDLSGADRVTALRPSVQTEIQQPMCCYPLVEHSKCMWVHPTWLIKHMIIVSKHTVMVYFNLRTSVMDIQEQAAASAYGFLLPF